MAEEHPESLNVDYLLRLSIPATHAQFQEGQRAIVYITIAQARLLHQRLQALLNEQESHEA